MSPGPAVPGAPGISLDLPEAEIWLFERFLDVDEAQGLLEVLVATTPWCQEPIRMFGREILQPRLIAWHGDPGATYTYSGARHEPAPWTPPLESIRDRLLPITGPFNSVLCNLYRDGRDRMGWHADDEPELGPSPKIASVSLGATRSFLLKHDIRKDLETVRILLASGSLLVMQGPTQRCWKHAVPGTLRPVGPRLNLTFRNVATCPGTPATQFCNQA